MKRNKILTEYIPNIRNFCKKIVPFVYFYKDTANVSKRKERKEEHSCFILVTNFIGLAYEGISSYLHYRRQRALHKAFVVMKKKVNLDQNSLPSRRFDGNVWHL